MQKVRAPIINIDEIDKSLFSTQVYSQSLSLFSEAREITTVSIEIPT